jgi:glutamate synthase (NADPH/NADH) large chain
VNDLFPGMPSKISGEGYALAAFQRTLKHEAAYDSAVARLPVGGFYASATVARRMPIRRS